MANGLRLWIRRHKFMKIHDDNGCLNWKFELLGITIILVICGILFILAKN